jgi:CubicO group peptidase (beta-lactamase class C family)
MHSFGWALIASTFFAAVVVWSTTNRAADVPDLAPAVDAIFQKLNSPAGPGCAVGVRRKGAPPLTRSYGSADLEHDAANTPSTVFEAGSVSKQFTAASILLLVKQGKLALTDDIRKYIPELPDYGWPITINELLTHTSGVRDWGDIEEMAGWPRTSRVYTMTDVLDIVARQKSLNYRPGTVYSYTNTGYDLLAIIVERVSHESLAQFSHDHLFVPLGMNHTQWRDDFRRVVKDRAIAYAGGNEGYRQAMPFEDTYGHGGLLTTVGDLLRWNDALSADELGHFVTAEMERQSILSDGRRIAYARGLMVGSYDGVREISHSGHTAGYRSWLGRYPDEHLSIALLCNSNDADVDKLAHAVADLLLPRQAPSVPVTLSPDRLAQRAGLFIDLRRQLPLRLEVHGDLLKVSNGPELTATSPSEFSFSSTTIRFNGNDDLVVETSDGDTNEYRRTPPWQVNPAELRSLVGDYASDEAMATYHLTLTGGHIVATPADRRDAALILEPVLVDTFAVIGPGSDIVLHFTRDANGAANGFEMRDARVYGLLFRRIPDTAHSP